MRLSSAQAGQVLKNDDNGSYYRYERPEGQRARIWPLERFPNGLLIAKTAPTTVDADLTVTVVGEWHDDFVVPVVGTAHAQATRWKKYEEELVVKQAELIVLRVAYEELPVDGVGVKSRGSHQNKIQAVEKRIVNLERGLAVIDPDMLPQAPRRPAAPKSERPAFGPNQLIQLPSGLPGAVLAMWQESGRWMAKIRTRFEDATLEVAFPCVALRPWSQSRVGTV